MDHGENGEVPPPIMSNEPIEMQDLESQTAPSTANNLVYFQQDLLGTPDSTPQGEPGVDLLTGSQGEPQECTICCKPRPSMQNRCKKPECVGEACDRCWLGVYNMEQNKACPYCRASLEKKRQSVEDNARELRRLDGSVGEEPGSEPKNMGGCWLYCLGVFLLVVILIVVMVGLKVKCQLPICKNAQEEDPQEDACGKMREYNTPENLANACFDGDSVLTISNDTRLIFPTPTQLPLDAVFGNQDNQYVYVTGVYKFATVKEIDFSVISVRVGPSHVCRIESKIALSPFEKTTWMDTVPHFDSEALVGKGPLQTSITCARGFKECTYDMDPEVWDKYFKAWAVAYVFINEYDHIFTNSIVVRAGEIFRQVASNASYSEWNRDYIDKGGQLIVKALRESFEELARPRLISVDSVVMQTQGAFTCEINGKV